MGRHGLLAIALLALTAGCGGGEDPAVRVQEPPARATASASPSAPVTPVALTFHPVIGDGDTAAVAAEVDPTQEATVLDEQGLPIRIGPAALTNDDVASAGADVDNELSTTLISVDFTPDGARRWEALTAQTACQAPQTAARRVAILIDGEVVSSPEVAASVECNVGIQGGSTQITGDFSKQEAQDLARAIDGR